MNFCVTPQFRVSASLVSSGNLFRQDKSFLKWKCHNCLPPASRDANSRDGLLPKNSQGKNKVLRLGAISNGSSTMRPVGEDQQVNVVSTNAVPTFLARQEVADMSEDAILSLVVENKQDVKEIGREDARIPSKKLTEAQALTARIQAAKIEAAKLKIAARIQQAEEMMKRAEEQRQAKVWLIDGKGKTEHRAIPAECDSPDGARSGQFSGSKQLTPVAIQAVNEDHEVTAQETIPNNLSDSIAGALQDGRSMSAPTDSVQQSTAETSNRQRQAAENTPKMSPTEAQKAGSRDSRISYPGMLPEDEDIPELLEDFCDALGPDAVTMPGVLECVMSHPGALSCTKTVIRMDPVRKSAVVTTETTTRCAGDFCMYNPLADNDYVALALQALTDSTHELKRRHLKQTADLDPLTDEKHRIARAVLRSGNVVSCSPMDPPSSFGHESFVVELVEPNSGLKLNAIFKPRLEGDAQGWHRVPIEWVAYELNLMLGMDYVPPVVYRTGGINVDWHRYNEGAFILWVQEAKPLCQVAAASWGVPVGRMLSDTRILDVLLNNSDRHKGHFIFGRHWAGRGPQPVLIDHAAGFRKEAVVKMEHENAFQTGPVRVVSAQTYLRLRFLEKEAVLTKFGQVLSLAEIDGMMKRRDEILAYLDNLVQSKGYNRIVID